MPNALEDAVAFHRRGNLARAEAIYRRLLKRHPGHPDALHLLGCIELGRGRRDTAIRLIGRAIDAAPNVALYHENLSEALHRAGRLDEAEAEIHLALRLGGRKLQCLNRLGVIALARGDLETAREYLREALEGNPLNAEALINLAAVLNRLGEPALSVETAGVALELEPENRLAWNNLGLALKGLGRFEEAARAFERAGDLPLARFNLGHLRLLEGNLAEGLPLVESRRRMHDPGRGLKGREWDGVKGGGRLLVVHEQGLGDTILMSRFLPALCDRFDGVTILVPEPLARVVASVDARLEVVTDLAGVRYDRWVPTVTLPLRLGVTSVEELGGPPWIPRTPPPKRAGALRAGINWAGNPSYHYDRSRSVSLSVVKPLLDMPGVEWVSLHKGHREAEAKGAGLAEPLRDARDFADTARALGELDLVVSTETAVPNLSGAMGIPTVVLAAVDYDWRWRGWFPDVEVAAQDAAGDWPSAVAKAVRAVEARRDAAVDAANRAA